MGASPDTDRTSKPTPVPPDGFLTERRRLQALAYNMTGSVATAEDIVQDAWLRWQTVDSSAVDSPRAYLYRIVVNLATTALARQKRERDGYPGEWLPEPWVTPWVPGADDAAEARELASLAVLHLLDRLGPAERSVFVLRTCLEMSYDEIAPVLGKSAAACRQIDSRARRRLGPLPDRAMNIEARAGVVQAFMAALAGEDKAGLLALLTDDAVVVQDGGGKVRAARNIVRSAEFAARLFLGLWRKRAAETTYLPCVVNGDLGMAEFHGERLHSVSAIHFRGGRIFGIYSVVAPAKLDAARQSPAFTPPDAA